MQEEVLRSDEIATEIDSRNEDCEPDCTYQGTYSGDVFLANYPNCPVEFEVDWCLTHEDIDGDGVKEWVVNFGDIDWGTINQSLDPDCQQLWNDIVNLIQNGTALAQQTFLNDVYAQAFSQLTEQWFEDNAAAAGPLANCDQPGSQQHFNIVRTAYMANCYQVCLFSDGTFLRNACGEACCTKTTGYCIDPVTGEIITEVFESTDISFANCTNPSFGCVNEDGDFPIATSPCLNTCE